MADQGLNANDLLRQSQVGTLKKNGNAPSQDPVAEAFAVRKNLLAQRIMDSSVTEMETASIKAENERLNALIEQQKLKQTEQPERTTDQWQQYIINQMEQLREQLAIANQEAQAAQQALLQQRMDILTSEIARLQQQPKEAVPSAPVDPVEQVSREIERARALLAQVTPPTPEPVLGYDPGLEKWRITAQTEDKERERQFQREQWKLEQTLQLQREELIHRIAREDQQAKSINTLVENTVPEAIKIFVQFAQAWISRNPVPGVAPSVAPAVAPAPRPAVQPPPDIHLMQCKECGTSIPFRDGMPEIICPQCFAVYTNDNAGGQSGRTEVSGHGVQSDSTPEPSATA